MRLLTGKSGDVHKEVPMDNRTRQIVKVVGEANDAPVVVKGTGTAICKVTLKAMHQIDSVAKKGAVLTAATPAAEPLAAVGGTIDAIASGFDIVNNLFDGDYAKAATNSLVMAVGKLLDNLIDGSEKKELISKPEKIIISDQTDKVLDKVKEKVENKPEDKKPN